MFRFKGIGSLLNRSGSIQPAWRHLLRRNTTSEAIPLPSRFSLLRQKLMEEGNGARKAVGYWMLGSGSLVFGLVVLGGLTRLTESGLSMVDWKLIHFQAPRNDEEWAAYFEKYKQFPEYQLNNRGMSLEEFKRIYWMEHSHRVYGRMLGLVILGPAAFFAYRGWASPKIKRAMLGLCGLVGFQGLLGWYMVKSGLSNEIIEKKQEARVSQYRLAAHLTSAFFLYLGLIGTGLKILVPAVPPTTPGLRQLKFLSTGMTHLILTTAVAGAFVAGMDAGLIYNTFPKMGAHYVPDDIWDPRLAWKNPFENPTTAQFIHRCLAYSSLGWATGFWWYSKRLALPRQLRLVTNIIMATVWAQGSLGLLTLLYCVPIPMASMHQAGSMIVLTACTYMLNLLRLVPK